MGQLWPPRPGGVSSPTTHPGQVVSAHPPLTQARWCQPAHHSPRPGGVSPPTTHPGQVVSARPPLTQARWCQPAHHSPRPGGVSPPTTHPGQVVSARPPLTQARWCQPAHHSPRPGGVSPPTTHPGQVVSARPPLTQARWCQPAHHSPLLCTKIRYISEPLPLLNCSKASSLGGGVSGLVVTGLVGRGSSVSLEASWSSVAPPTRWSLQSQQQSQLVAALSTPSPPPGTYLMDGLNPVVFPLSFLVAATGDTGCLAATGATPRLNPAPSVSPTRTSSLTVLAIACCKKNRDFCHGYWLP